MAKGGALLSVRVALLPIAAVAAAPLSAATAVLEPSGAWVIDYANEKCRLARPFGGGKQLAVLFFEQGSPGENFALSAAGPQLKRFEMSRTTFVRFSDAGEERQTRPFTGDIKTIGPAVIYSSLDLGPEGQGKDGDQQADRTGPGLPHIDLAEAAAADFIELRQGKHRVRFATGNLKDPMEALNRCSADLVRSWGLDLDRHRTARQLPVWTNREAIVRRIVAEYPGPAARIGEQGVVRMRVMVDPSGAVTDCKLDKATRSEALESPACKAMVEARFEPALDADGVAMPSYYAETIVYKMAGGTF